MVARTLGRRIVGVLTLLGSLTLLLSLMLLTNATQNAEDYGHWHTAVLIINIVGILVLSLVIGFHVFRLWRRYRRRLPGARLNARVLGMFSLLVVAPLLVVFYFSIQFLNRGIDQYFNADLDQALTEALDLSRMSLDLQVRAYSEQTAHIVDESGADKILDDPVHFVSQAREFLGANELTLLGANSRVIASSSIRPENFPQLPEEELLISARAGLKYAALDPDQNGQWVVRTVIPVQTASGPLTLYAIFRLDERMKQLADHVEQRIDEYSREIYMRRFLKSSFTMTLTLVLLVSMLASIYGAFVFSRRLIAPVQALVSGTRAVAEGDFSTRLAEVPSDDLGFLVESFNSMTERLQTVRDDAEHSRRIVERERTRLAIILARLSSGVLVLDKELVIHIANKAASTILNFDFKPVVIGQQADSSASSALLYNAFIEYVRTQFKNDLSEWREQIELPGPDGRRVLVCASTALPSAETGPQRFVIVFDDVTKLLRAQRDAAWGEVARRLAHEIKNPLTPIQLSAERLRNRLAGSFTDAKNEQLLKNATQTIIHQVEIMQDMVNEFSEYARTRDMKISDVDLNAVVLESIDLYQHQEQSGEIQAILHPRLRSVRADAGRIRQILHNLIRNALEACHECDKASIEVLTRTVNEGDHVFVELEVRDSGPGFKLDVEEVFEPYRTTKARGTGLGLAIVKRLMEEHSGEIVARNREQGGASVICRFPCAKPDAIHSEAA